MSSALQVLHMKKSARNSGRAVEPVGGLYLPAAPALRVAVASRRAPPEPRISPPRYTTRLDGLPRDGEEATDVYQTATCHMERIVGGGGRCRGERIPRPRRLLRRQTGFIAMAMMKSTTP
ncbi:PREDICTED: uncharacterized protein LOC106127147 [Papilio xuthus]|uniref:Uncharacterized protein LOC106127147 n=1 Tax=Papilio xuthus TaxID=66420 RepID=A0AAJ6ZX10_PAPXU|nr:PREDICTED: uncharacterized protein LOC106127147 [Papilio xuthus]